MPLWITEEQVKELLPMGDCLLVLEELFRQASTGQTVNRSRSRIRMPDGFFHVMAGSALGSRAFGLKAYTTFREPAMAVVLLYDCQGKGECQLWPTYNLPILKGYHFKCCATIFVTNYRPGVTLATAIDKRAMQWCPDKGGTSPIS